MGRAKKSAVAVLRRAGELIHINDGELAARLILEPRQSATDDTVSRLAKAVLSRIETTVGNTFQGLGQAGGAIKLRFAASDATWPKSLRGLHEAFCLVRHITEVGETKYLEQFEQALARLQPPTEKGKAETTGKKGKGKETAAIADGFKEAGGEASGRPSLSSRRRAAAR